MTSLTSYGRSYMRAIGSRYMQNGSSAKGQLCFAKSGFHNQNSAGVTRAAVGGGGAGSRWLSTSSNQDDDAIPKMMSGPQRAMIGKTKGRSEEDDNESWAAQQRMMTDRIFSSEVAKTEAEIRQDLKVAHRLMAKFGYDDLVWNHISARCGAEQTRAEDCSDCDLPDGSFLITPGGMHFSEVRSEDFVFDSIDEAGNVIHSGIYEHRDDVRAIIHVHTEAITAVSVLEGGFRFLTQDSAPFFNRLGYHKYEGLHSAIEEKERIAESLGDGIALIMRNHGATIVGSSIQEAWVRCYYLDRCCRIQLQAMATGDKLIECSDDLLIHASKQIDRYFPHGRFEWSALKRLVDR